MAGDKISNQLMVHGKKGKGRKIFSQSINLFNYELQKTFLKEESSPALAVRDTRRGQGGRYPHRGCPPYPLEGGKEAESSELPSPPLGELPSTPLGSGVQGFRKVGMPLTPEGLTGAEPPLGVGVKSNPLVFFNQIKPYRDGESSSPPFSPFLPKGIASQKGEHPDRVGRSILPDKGQGGHPLWGYRPPWPLRVRARVGTPKGVQLPSTLSSSPLTPSGGIRGEERQQPRMGELPSTLSLRLPPMGLGLGAGVSLSSPTLTGRGIAPPSP